MEKQLSHQAKANLAPDTLDSLIDERSVVRRLFKEFDQVEGSADPSRKVELAKAICREISVKTGHAGERCNRND
jgi:hypothetical protein